jgi:hypothetical protein
MKRCLLTACLIIVGTACGGASRDSLDRAAGPPEAATQPMISDAASSKAAEPEADQGPTMPDRGIEDGATDASGLGSVDATLVGEVDSAGTEGTRDAVDLADGDASEESDGPRTSCDTLCAARGIGTCSGEQCVIDCSLHNSCTGKVQCPPGMPCRVLCSTADSCAAGVDCTGASQCDIQCSGRSSCSGLVQCAGASCTIACAEQDSCSRRVDCSADQCNLTCTGNHACAGGVACIGATQACTLDCAGQSACAGGVQGVGSSDIRCLGFLSCATLVSCVGKSCAIHCLPVSCGGATCCQSAQCDYNGTTKRCQ